jgi:hypothetical protein
MNTWQQLRDLRQAGKSPALMLIIVSPKQYRLRQTFESIGSMVIEHSPGEPIQFELLADLDVMLLLDSCKAASEFAEAQRSAQHPTARMRAWCQCSAALTVICDMGCKL